MARYHQSGTRRDACALLYAAGSLRGQKLKTRLEARYDAGVDPRDFYAMLDGLQKAGHVEKHQDGIHDVYALTEKGERAFEAHYEWLTECVEDRG